MNKLEAEAEVAIESFYLYVIKNYKLAAAFSLPSWFVEARELYGLDKTRKLWKELDEQDKKQDTLGNRSSTRSDKEVEERESGS